jgi:tight adherence protein C
LFIAFSSLAVAGYAYVIDRRRQALLTRAFGIDAVNRAPLLAPAKAEGPSRLQRFADRYFASGSAAGDALRARLVRAGREDPRAVATYAAYRLALMVLVPVIALLLFAPPTATGILVAIVGGAIVGWIAPSVMLDGAIRRRQQALRASIADTLDLMLVCVEAGVSLESAMLRVARELVGVHPEMAYELTTALRRMKAGMSREDALRGLYIRTGVEELRSVASNILQSERWGTGIARVLRITAETVRRRRRQIAERRAQTVALKMTLPLVLLILPSLFIAVLGPTILAMYDTLTR